MPTRTHHKRAPGGPNLKKMGQSDTLHRMNARLSDREVRGLNPHTVLGTLLPSQKGLLKFLFPNDLIHDGLWGIEPVPVGNKRKETDFSISGSLTRWWALVGQKRILYLSGGIQSGSLFHEAFAEPDFDAGPLCTPLNFSRGNKTGLWPTSFGLYGFLAWSGPRVSKLARPSMIWQTRHTRRKAQSVTDGMTSKPCTLGLKSN